MKSRSGSGKIPVIREHPRLFAFLTVVALIGVSVLAFEEVTQPPSQIPVYSELPYNAGNPGFVGYNGSTHPHQVNVSAQSYAATFEMEPTIPLVIYPGSFETGFGMSVLNDSVNWPYSGISFYVVSASVTIENYTMDRYYFTGGGRNESLGLMFSGGATITLFDKAGKNYTGFYSVTVVPVLHFGILYFKQPPETLMFHTNYPWYHVE